MSVAVVPKSRGKSRADVSLPPTPAASIPVSPVQLTLASLAGVPAIEWEEAELGLHLLPATVGPAPDRSLVASIRSVGVVSPVVVLEIASGSGTAFEVVDGHRRIAAARLAGRTSVPARIGRASHAFSAALSLVMNEQRSSNPVAEYAAIRDLQAAGLGESEIARVTGIGVGTIRKRMGLAGLHPELMAAFREGAVRTSVAEAAAKLPGGLQAALVEEVRAGRPVTLARVAEVKRARADSALASLALAMGDSADAPEAAPADPVRAAISGIRAAIAETPEGFLSERSALTRVLAIVDELEERIG